MRAEIRQRLRSAHVRGREGSPRLRTRLPEVASGAEPDVLAFARMFSGPAIDRFFEELASEAEDPGAARQRQRGLHGSRIAEHREFSSSCCRFWRIGRPCVSAAIEAATGLSVGLEAEKFLSGSIVLTALSSPFLYAGRGGGGSASQPTPWDRGRNPAGGDGNAARRRRGTIYRITNRTHPANRFLGNLVQLVRGGAAAASGTGCESCRSGTVRHRRDQRGRGTWDRDPVHRGRTDALDQLARRQGERLRASCCESGAFRPTCWSTSTARFWPACPPSSPRSHP